MLSDDFVNAQREFKNQYEKITIENLDETESTPYRRKFKSILKVQQEEEINEKKNETLEERFGVSRVEYRKWEEYSQEIGKTTAAKAIADLVEIKRKHEMRREKRSQSWGELNIDFNTLSVKEIFEKLKCTCTNRSIVEVITEGTERIDFKNLMRSVDLQQELEPRADSLFGIEENASKHEWTRKELRKYFEDASVENTKKMWRTFNEFKSEMEVKKETQELEMFEGKEEKDIIERKEKLRTPEGEQEPSMISLKLREESSKAVGFGSLSDIELWNKPPSSISDRFSDKFSTTFCPEDLKALYQSELENILQQFLTIKDLSTRFVIDIIEKAEAHASRIRHILPPTPEKHKDSKIIEADNSKKEFLKLFNPGSLFSIPRRNALTEELERWEKLHRLNLGPSAAVRRSGQYEHVFKFDRSSWKVVQKEWVTVKPYFVNSNSTLMKFVGNALVPVDPGEPLITSALSLGQGDEGSGRSQEEWNLLIKDFNLLTGKEIIRKFVSTWKRKESWGYCIDFIREKSDSTSDFYFYEVKWSVPTSSFPIPASTVIVYFTIEVPRILPANCPAIITYNFEGCNTSYALTDLERPEEFLKDTLQYKLKLFQRITF